MTRLVIDTHIWVWAIYDSSKLSRRIRELIVAADLVMVPTVSIYEIGQKVRLRKWPGMSVAKLNDLIADARGKFEFVATSMPIALRASLIEWDHRDPFDRIIAATALEERAALVSRDGVFEGVGGLQRLWEAV